MVVQAAGRGLGEKAPVSAVGKSVRADPFRRWLGWACEACPALCVSMGVAGGGLRTGPRRLPEYPGPHAADIYRSTDKRDERGPRYGPSVPAV